MGGDAPVTPRYGDGYGAVSPAGARYKANPQPAKVAGAAAAAASAVARPPLSARGDRLSLNMSPRWQAPQLTPRLHPDDIAAAVRQSSYIRARQVVPQAYRDIVPPLPPTPPPGARSSRTPDTAKEPAPLHETEAEAAPTSEQDSVPEPEPEPGSSEEAAPALKTAKLPDVNGYVYSTTESESEEEEDDEMDDEFDAQMLMMAQKRTKGGGGNAAGRRMSLADMQGSDMMAGMAVLRESLSEIEIEEYRDFFDLVDDDKSNSINATELKNVMVMMGMEAPDEQVKAMIGEVQDPAAMEMKFDEFLTLMAIFVGPRGDRQAEELQEAFNAIDDDGGGTIDREELSDAFKKYGEPVTDAECNELIEMADKEGKGEINIDEFKDMMMSALPKDATESARTLKRKARTTVRALIMRKRMSDAFSNFQPRYNFLRFTDAKTLAPDDEKIYRIHQATTVADATKVLRENGVLTAPVYADEACREDPIGFVDLMDIVHLMLQAMKLAFKLPATDPISIQMRLDRITESAGQFANTPVSQVVEKQWRPIRPGYSVYDAGMVLAKGAPRVPYVGDDNDLAYVISQWSFIKGFNEDTAVRLGGVGHLTAEALGGLKSLTTVTEKQPLMTAFNLLAEPQYAGAVAVVQAEDSDHPGSLFWYISADTLKLAGETADELAIALSKPILNLYDNKLEEHQRTIAAKGISAFKQPAVIRPTTTLQQMIRLIVEEKAHRLWMVDDANKPIGVMSLTNIISCIMRT